MVSLESDEHRTDRYTGFSYIKNNALNAANQKRRDTNKQKLMIKRKQGFKCGGSYQRKVIELTEEQKEELERKRDLSTYVNRKSK